MSDHEDPAPAYSGPGRTPRGRARPPASKRRDKPQLSCKLCRRLKLKCDRAQPCSSCVKRGLVSTCTYTSGRSLPGNDLGQAPPRLASKLQDRLQKLENSVLDLMRDTTGHDAMQIPHTGVSRTRSAQTNDSPASTTLGEDLPEDASIASDRGSMRLNKSGSSYVNSSHWAAVLGEIAELKDHLEEEAELQCPGNISSALYPSFSGPQLLYGCPRYASKAEILEAVPPRPVVDRLISRYFNSFDMSPVVIHTAQFLKEYERFWESPSSTPSVWLGLLFTIMCLAAQFQKFSLDPGAQLPPSAGHEGGLETMVEAYRLKTVQCLILGRYANGGPYVLETLMLYFTIEHILCKDADVSVWILLSTIVQLAMHMGYHRDPRHFSGMSAFAGEMRRRVWATIVELDLGFSAQMGLPRLIKPWQSDTAEPRNLLDADFDKNAAELPPSRSVAEYTPMLYRLVKARMLAAFGLVWDFAADISYEPNEVTKIDAKLEEALKALPDCLKWRSLASCIFDSPQVILQKVVLQIIYYRARIVLYRKYISHAQDADQYAHYREVCVTAALELLDLQHLIDENTQPFCQLYQERWRISSIINHDFLLATSILCFYFQEITGEPSDVGDSALVEKIMQAVERSHDIWLRSSDASKEARKAAKALSVVIGNRKAPPAAAQAEATNPAGLQSLAGSNYLTTGHQGHHSGTNVAPPFVDPMASGGWRVMMNDLTGSYLLPALALAPSSTHGQQMTYSLDTMTSPQWP